MGKEVEDERGKWVFRILLTKDDKVSFRIGETKTILICPCKDCTLWAADRYRRMVRSSAKRMGLTGKFMVEKMPSTATMKSELLSGKACDTQFSWDGELLLRGMCDRIGNFEGDREELLVSPIHNERIR